MRLAVYFVSSCTCRAGGSGSDIPFSVCSLAGTAGCQLLLHPGGAALFCLRCAALRVSGFLPKNQPCRTASFPAPPENAELGLGSRCHPASGRPARSRAEKGDSIMYQNRISLIGFVGNDVQLKSTKNGTPVAVLSVATKSSGRTARAGTIRAPSGIAAQPGQTRRVRWQAGERCPRSDRGRVALSRV